MHTHFFGERFCLKPVVCDLNSSVFPLFQTTRLKDLVWCRDASLRFAALLPVKNTPLSSLLKTERAREKKKKEPKTNLRKTKPQKQTKPRRRGWRQRREDEVKGEDEGHVI